jgi:ABC-type arginine transport system permease subunit
VAALAIAGFEDFLREIGPELVALLLLYFQRSNALKNRIDYRAAEVKRIFGGGAV